jgi:hypothetical protein
LSGLEVDLDSPLDAWPVARVVLFGCPWIEPSQQTVQVLSTVPFAYAVQPPAKRLVRLWADKERSPQRAEVKSGPADEQWNTATAFDLFNLARGFTRPLDRGVVERRRNKIDQVVRYAFPFFEWNFRCSYLNFLVNLNGVAIDNLAVELERHLDPERAFA